MNSITEAQQTYKESKPRIRCHFNPLDSDGYYSLTLVSGANFTDALTGNLIWHTWFGDEFRLAKTHPNRKALDFVFKTDQPLDKQLYQH